jgi:peptidoglycan/xylan/chitin deacetylase (PgdA/CDA1 family)
MLSDELRIVGGPSHDCVVAPPRYPRSAVLANLTRKISSRLASRVPVDVRRLANAAPIVSFTFDDVPESAHSRGAALLESAGSRGTYYVSTALLGRRTPEWTLIDRDGVADLHQRGHEIGLHTHSHRAVSSLSREELCVEVEENRARLRDISPSIDPQNFAYPFGFASFPRKLQLSRLVNSSRSVKPGINVGAFDAQYVRCVELVDARLSRAELEVFLNAVVVKNGWLVFLSHDVSASPSPYGCSTSLFERALDGVAARGIEVVTVAEALRRSRRAGPAWSSLAAMQSRLATARERQ